MMISRASKSMPITMAAIKFCDNFLDFLTQIWGGGAKDWHFIGLVLCHQTIFMKCEVLIGFLKHPQNFRKASAANIWCRFKG